MTSDEGSLERRIAEHFDLLTPKQRDVARVILDNRYQATFASAAELGEKVNASAATVVRFCQALGYEGLPDLQTALRSELPTYLTAVERLERRRTLPQAGDDDAAARAFAADIRNLQRTTDALDHAQFRRVVDLLANAREIVVIGGGVVAAPAHFLAYSLRVIGLSARAVVEADVTQVVNIAHVTPQDVVVGIGIWRYIVSTVEALAYAAKAGAHTVAITDSIVSPLARRAEHALGVATEGIAHSVSVTAMMGLINALVADVALRDPERTRQALLRVDGQYKQRGLIIQ